MIVADLNVSNELDQAALSAVAGGGIISRQYLGSTMQTSSWAYRGERATHFLGYVYVAGKGWKRKLRTQKTWTRTQIFKSFYNVVVC